MYVYLTRDFFCRIQFPGSGHTLASRSVGMWGEADAGVSTREDLAARRLAALEGGGGYGGEGRYVAGRAIPPPSSSDSTRDIQKLMVRACAYAYIVETPASMCSYPTLKH